MSDKGDGKIKAVLETTGKKIASMVKNLKPEYYYYVTIIIVAFILFALFSWIYSTLSLKSTACDRLNILYPETSPLNRSFMNTRTRVNDPEKFDKDLASIFRNYYVKASYNSCCGDGYKNNFVNICALEKAIIAGARFLDFEIYSYNNIPIIASSTAGDNNIKEVYNYLTVEEVFETLNYKSFDGSVTSCEKDPMIINLRFMTENISIFNKVAKLIREKLNFNPQSKRVDTFLYLKSTEKLLLQQPIKNLSKKFIIIAGANPSNNIFNDTDLDELINLKSNGEFCKMYRYDTIRSKGFDNIPLSDATRNKYVIVLPNLTNDLNNYDIELLLSNGSQAMCMKFQNMDNNLLAYHELFKNNGNYSFILKPPDKRADLDPPITTDMTRTFNALSPDAMSNALTGQGNASSSNVSMIQTRYQPCTEENQTICANYNATCLKGSSGDDICRFQDITNENDCNLDEVPGNWEKCNPADSENSTFCENNDNFPGTHEGRCLQNATSFKCSTNNINTCQDLGASYCLKSHNAPYEDICVYKNIQESDCTGNDKIWANCESGNPYRPTEWCNSNPNFPGTDPSGICISNANPVGFGN